MSENAPSLVTLALTGICIASKDEDEPQERICKAETNAKAGLLDGIHITKPKIPIWVIFGGSGNGRSIAG
jgi:hypothetical protein